MLDRVQCNYYITEKEPFAVVFALKKLRSYLFGTKVVVFIYMYVNPSKNKNKNNIYSLNQVILPNKSVIIKPYHFE